MSGNEKELKMEELETVGGGLAAQPKTPPANVIAFIRACKAKRITITETVNEVVKKFGYSLKEAKEIVGLYWARS